MPRGCLAKTQKGTWKFCVGFLPVPDLRTKLDDDFFSLHQQSGETMTDQSVRSDEVDGSCSPILCMRESDYAVAWNSTALADEVPSWWYEGSVSWYLYAAWWCGGEQ